MSVTLHDGAGLWARDLAAGALLAIAGVTALALLNGASIEASREANSLRRAHYVLALAFIGAGVVVAWRIGLRVAAAATALLLVGGVATQAPADYKPVMSLNAGLTVLAVLGTHLAAAEYAIRNPVETKQFVTSSAVERGALVGVAHVGLVFGLHAWLGFSTAYFYTLGNVAIYAWMAVGALLVGTTVGALWFQHRLVLPAVVVGWLLAEGVAATLPYVAELRSGSSAIAGTLFTLYEIAWFTVLVAALVVAGVEYALRTWLAGAVAARGS